MPTKAELEKENAKLRKELKLAETANEKEVIRAEKELILTQESLQRAHQRLEEMEDKYIAESTRHMWLRLYVRVHSMPDDELGHLTKKFKPTLKNNG